MSKTAPIATFQEFWQLYVREHQNPVNQTLHVLGSLAGVTCVLLAVAGSKWWLLAAMPAGYGPSWLGHFLFERNVPLTLTYPGWSLRADIKLVLRLLLRRPLIKAPQQVAEPTRNAA